MALIESVIGGHLEMSRFLIEKGADIHIREDQALISACQGGHLGIVKLLIENGADIHAQTERALESAIQFSKDIEIVKLLIGNGADVRLIPYYILEMMVQLRDWDLAKYLIENGANIHAKVLRGSARDGNFEMVRFLIEHGVDINDRQDEERDWNTRRQVIINDSKPHSSHAFEESAAESLWNITRNKE